MRAEATAAAGAPASPAVAPDLGAVQQRIAAFIASGSANAVCGWLVAFVLVLALAADSGGYWPTAWGWTSLSLLFLSAVILISRTGLRIDAFEAILPAGLLGLTVWNFASGGWSASATQPLLQGQRALAYAAAVFAMLLLVRAGSYRPLLGGVWAAITLVCVYSLVTRLFPERAGFVDSFAGFRLQAPLGYWNALAILAALGTLLAVGFAARGGSAAVRMLAAASTVFLVPALYFTYSRGGWVALGLGFVTMVALDSRRLQLVTTLAVVAPWPALAVWHASGSEALTHIGGGLAAAEHAGHRYALYLTVVALAAAGSMLAYVMLERRVRVPGLVRVAFAALLVLALVAGLAATTARYGSPPTIARTAYDGFLGPTREVTNGDLNTRLFSLSSNGRIGQWKVAWREYTEHPWLGTGAGSYERYWNEYRPSGGKVRNAHNLYLETLAELGPVGLGLLVIALGAPLVAAVRARRRLLVPAAAAAYVAFLGHAAVDWDWQMPAVTLAALFCGVALLVAARPAQPAGRLLPQVWRGVALGLVVVLGVAAFVGLRGNIALAASRDATAHADFAKAAREARSARAWAPWSSEPWRLLGEAQAAMGQRAAARASFEHALAKNRQDWAIWLDLAVASDGAERKAAFAAATSLNPLSPEIASWKEG